LSTNKFYANLFLGSQTNPVWTHPYSVAWSAGGGVVKSWGLSISQIDRSQVAYGPGNPSRYFINPVGIQSMILSASELGNKTVLTTDSLTAFSVNANLAPSSGASPKITFPLVQGMGFITGIYNNASPLIQSAVSILALTYVGPVSGGTTHKYKAGLGDQTTWLIYITPQSLNYPGNTFTLMNGYNINGTSGFTGTIQIAKVATSLSPDIYTYDASAGAYATGATISGSAQGVTGTYSLTWSKGGYTNRPLITFALPHHVQTLSGANITNIQLETTTKGMATAVVGDSWTLVESDLPTDIGLAPWSTNLGTVTSVSSAAMKLINDAATAELSQDINAQTDLNSMYYSGKGFAKFAGIVFAAHDVAGNKTLAYTGLQKLEAAFSLFVNNSQIYPLVYESAWGGLVSSGTYTTGDDGLDFGNAYYNDHHFHYSYFVYAAAIIGYLDPTWMTSGNIAWVNALVRDYANPSTSDPYFPFSRSFDWYHGHSWAKGLYASGDGKDQESSSEDSLSAYALKMWGLVSKNVALEARGTLQMAVQARSIQNYFLYTSDNTVEPSAFIGNKVSGIVSLSKPVYYTNHNTNGCCSFSKIKSTIQLISALISNISRVST